MYVCRHWEVVMRSRYGEHYLPITFFENTQRTHTVTLPAGLSAAFGKSVKEVWRTPACRRRLALARAKVVGLTGGWQPGRR